jgi:hypothetical protein
VVARLETISRTVSEAFRRADEVQKRHAVLLACEIAVSQADLHGTAVDAALAVLRQGGSNGAARLAIEALSDQLDSEYFALQEEDGPVVRPSEALLQFRKARAAAALGFALSPIPEDLGEALYEAMSASDDQAAALNAVRLALR